MNWQPNLAATSVFAGTTSHREGRGEIIEPVGELASLDGKALLLVRPAFGIPTPWAYKSLVNFPEARNRPLGQAEELAKRLAKGDLIDSGDCITTRSSTRVRKISPAEADEGTRPSQRR